MKLRLYKIYSYEFFFFPILWFLSFFFFLTRLNFHNVAQKLLLLLLLLLLWGGLFVCLFFVLFCLYSISGYPVGAINFVFTTVILKYNSCRILLIYLFTYICISHAKGSSCSTSFHGQINFTMVRYP